MKTLKNHRACGTDMIPNKLLKYGGLALVEHMASDRNIILDRGEMISTV